MPVRYYAMRYVFTLLSEAVGKGPREARKLRISIACFVSIGAYVGL